MVVDNVGAPASLHKEADDFLKPEGTYMQVGSQFELGAMAK